MGNEGNSMEVEATTTEEERLEAFFLEQDLEVEKQPILNQKAMRLAVAYLFVRVHGSPEDESDWKGQDSVGTKVRNALGFNRSTKINSIFWNVQACKKEGITYTRVQGT
jgi:hypothetical protein